MADATASERGTPPEGTFSIVPVPEEHVQAVLDFLAALDRSDADVAGHMLGLGPGASSGGGGLAAKHLTKTNATYTGGPSQDFKFSDDDTNTF